MKKIILLVCSLMVATTLFAQKKVTLGYNLQMGKEYYVNQSTNVNMTMGMQGMSNDITQKMDMVLAYKVTGVHADYYDIDLSYKSMSVTVGTPDGQSQGMSMGDGGAFDAFENLVIKAKMDRSGKMRDIVIPEGTLPTGSGLDMNSLMKSLGGVDGMYPMTPVAPGDKWSSETDIDMMGLKMNINMEYEYVGQSGKERVIRGNAKIDTPQSSVMEMQGMKVPVNVEGNVTGEFTVDSKTGWIKSVSNTMNMDGSMTFDVPGQGTANVSIIMVMTTTQTDKPAN